MSCHVSNIISRGKRANTFYRREKRTDFRVSKVVEGDFAGALEQFSQHNEVLPMHPFNPD